MGETASTGELTMMAGMVLTSTRWLGQAWGVRGRLKHSGRVVAQAGEH
jgi:hypothetical protein